MSEAGYIQMNTTPRRRKRHSVSPDERVSIANRVVDFYNTEKANREPERQARIERYAKYRLWTNGTNWPWDDASDLAIPDLLQDSLRIQDTLVNAVMSQSPPVVSRANVKGDEEKQDTIDKLIQHQLFSENAGEVMIGALAESFVNDPACTVFIPWVKEKRPVAEVTLFDEIPRDTQPKEYFFQIVRDKFPTAKRYDPSSGGWDYTVVMNDDSEIDVCFYTNEIDGVEMVATQQTLVFDGPRPFVKDYEDVLFPARSENLQMPGPSNPNGASFVILRDFPTVAELKRLKKSGFYDLLSKDELEALESATNTSQMESDSARQKDKLSGSGETVGKPREGAHKRLTRLTCFDTYDIDGDGIEEDVIFWVILETKTLLKCRLLSDLYPGNPPMRPLVGASFLPVGGRYSGMSLLEMMESMHDAVKVLADQSINATDLAIASPGFYRPTGGMNPEVLKISPFTLSPLQNPQQDVVFPQIGNQQAMGNAMNMITTFGAWQDKLTMVSDLSFGGIPKGGSSALRTIGGMSMVQGQGEARPERILRRFFMILTGICRQIHRLNQTFLPKNKQFRVTGVSMPGQDPYIKVDQAENIAGDFMFDFDANVLNTSKASLQQALQALMGVYITPLMLQSGVIKPEGIYRLARDYGKSYGQNVDQYITPPSPEAARPRIMAEEAIYQIMRDQMPVGAPLEPGGPQEHMDKLTAFAESIEFGHLTEPQVDLFKQYLLSVRDGIAQQAQAMQMQQNAAMFQQGRQSGVPGAPVQNPAQPQGTPQISGPNEMMDETLPTAGGGANAV